jgi:hypothetical protein
VANSGPKHLDISGVAAGFIGSSRQSSTSGSTQGPRQPSIVQHWAAGVCRVSPVLKRMNHGQVLTVAAVSDAAARVRRHLNPGSKVGWEAEPVLLEQLAAHPPVLRFCAGVEAFGQNHKVAASVLGLIADYPGYDHLMEDLAAAYATLKLPTPPEDAEYKFLRDLTARPQLVHCLKQLRRNRMSRLALIPGSVSTLMEEFQQLQNAYIKCVNADVAALKALQAAEKAVAVAKAQRLEYISPVKAKLSQMQALTSSKLTAEERASAREAHQSSPHLQDTCTINCFLETLQLKKVGANVAASMSSFSDMNPGACAAELALKTQEAAKNVEQNIERLCACIRKNDSTVASGHDGNLASTKSPNSSKDIADLIGIWEASLREPVPSGIEE